MKKNLNGQNEHECESCGRCFSAPQYLEKHVRDTHTKYECDQCSESFETHIRLRRHLVAHNAMDKHFECVYCRKGFPREISLRSHMFKHTGVKPFQCKCGNRFVTLSKYRAHRKLRPTNCKLLRYVKYNVPRNTVID